MPHEDAVAAAPWSPREDARQRDRDETQRASEIEGQRVPSRFARSTTGEDDELRALAAGLDALQTDAASRASVWRRIRQSVLPPIVCVIVLIAAWQLYVVIAQPRPDITPAPADVLAALGSAWDSGQLQQAVLTSLERGILGFLIAIVIGTPVGLLLAEVKSLRRAFGPLISGCRCCRPSRGCRPRSSGSA